MLTANVISYLFLTVLTFPFTYFPNYGMSGLFRQAQEIEAQSGTVPDGTTAKP